MKKKAPKSKQERMTDAELQQFVLDYLAGDIVIGQSVPQDLWPLVFMPLFFMKQKDLDRLSATCGEVYGNLKAHKTVGRSVNGFPIFVECGTILKADWKILCDTIERERARPNRVELVK